MTRAKRSGAIACRACRAHFGGNTVLLVGFSGVSIEEHPMLQTWPAAVTLPSERPSAAAGSRPDAAATAPRVRRVFHRPSPTAARVVVAIPARNEEALIPRCLDAVDRTLAGLAAPAMVVVLVNDSDDDSFTVASAGLAATPHPALVVDVDRPPQARHAGGARRAALDLAAALAAPGGFLLTTDADSVPEPGWAAASVRALTAGNDLVCGRVRVDRGERDSLPPALRHRHRLEEKVKAAAVVLEDRLDPRPHNPGPRHADVFAAALAVRRDAYLAVGGLPPVACGEDEALVRRMIDEDRPVYFARDAVVCTSLRARGRAAGGVADAIAARLFDPEAPCDASVPRAAVVARRAVFRRRLRELWRRGLDIPKLAAFAGAAPPPEAHARFGRLHAWFEARRGGHPPRPLRPRELPAELARYAALLKQVPAPAAAGPRRAS
jgi:hypothetical protein